MVIVGDNRKDDPQITFRGVDKRYGSSLVLENIALEAYQGDFVSIIGPSGCGKSTLLRIAAGLTEASKGSFSYLANRDGNKDIAYVFQDSTLLPWLNVAENVVLPLRIRGTPKADCLALTERLLQRVGLGAIGELYPRQLSGGMKMRVSIARALSISPNLLLLDEPFGALDEMTRDALNEELLRLREQRQWTALVVTHSVSEAVFLSSKIVVLAANPGRIADVVEVALPYPRTPGTRQMPEFGELVRQTTAALHSVQKKETSVAAI